MTFHISIDFTLWVDHAQGKENNTETMGLVRQKQYGLLTMLQLQLKQRTTVIKKKIIQTEMSNLVRNRPKQIDRLEASFNYKSCGGKDKKRNSIEIICRNFPENLRTRQL